MKRGLSTAFMHSKAVRELSDFMQSNVNILLGDDNGCPRSLLPCHQWSFTGRSQHMERKAVIPDH